MRSRYDNMSALGDLRVTVIGAAREGSAAARFLATLGARVTLSDTQSAEALADNLNGLTDLDIRLVLGEQPLSLLDDIDLLVVSPGVPPDIPIISEARTRGIPISSEPRLFTQFYPGLLVGVTGSSGKSTTTSLIGAMYRADGHQALVGGNIGEPLAERLLDVELAEVAVMELSSFQLELFTPDYQGDSVEQERSQASRAVSLGGWSPPVAVVTNITPNHLDRHPSMEDYISAKRQIVAHQTPQGWAILNADDETSYAFKSGIRGHLLEFSLQGAVHDGAYMHSGKLWLRRAGETNLVCGTEAVRLRGRHNLANILAASCAAAAGGVSIEAIREVAMEFDGLPHRLEPIRRWHDILFVNDSIATSPERAVAALRAYSEPIVLLAGGRDKHLPWDVWRTCVAQQARAVVAFGELVPIVKQEFAAMDVEQRGLNLVCVESLPEAVRQAAELARGGDVVLLSPGGTSYDAYPDFEARGEHYRRLVMDL